MTLADLRTSFAQSVSAADVRDWAEAAGKVLVLFGAPAAIGAWWKRRKRRRLHERVLRDAVADVVCVLADAQKASMAQEFDGYFTEKEYRDKRAVLRDRLLKARARLWEAMGFPESTDENAREQVAFLRGMRMTQRWNAEEAARIQKLLRK